MSLLFILTVFFGFLSPGSIQSEDPGKEFPRIKTRLLSGVKATFPDHIEGDFALVSLVFEKAGRYEKPQLQANNWQKAWQEKLKPLGIRFFEIPMMNGFYWVASSWINSGMRSGVDRDLYDNIACFYGDKMRYAQILKITDITECYVALIDPEGRIVYEHKGDLEQSALDQLVQVFNSLKP